MAKRAVRVTAVAASAQLGGTERVLLDFAARAFEHDINLRVVTPRGGPLIRILNELGIPAEVVPASERMLAGSQRAGHWWTLPGSAAGLITWARRLGRHPFFQDADAIYTVAFKAHLAVAWLRRHPVVWHLHEYPPAATSIVWRLTSRFVPDAMIANSNATAEAWGGRATYNVQRTTGVERGRRTLHAARCTVVMNGVDLDRFRPRPRSYWIHEQLGIPREHRIIGMPAVFARWKGQPEVIKAFSVIRSQFSDVHLVIVGGSIYDTVAEREYGVELRASIEGEGQAARGRGEPTGERFPFPVSRFPQVHLLAFQPKIELV
ncbi:MAG: glycosyltransferase family 4 protein, partial [Gemmatimonadetes bacterium]|nr:glycosyltransferase family 4 protein [Gemmatimonadota bacterium]